MAVAAASAALATAAMNRATAAGWEWATDTAPPHLAVKPRRWGRVLTWTAATAAAAAVASLLAQEGAAYGWKKTTGKRPPRTKTA